MSFRGIFFDNLQGDLGQMANIEAIGGTFLSNEAILAGDVVALLDASPDRVVKAKSDDATRRNAIGIALDASVGGGDRIRVVMWGRAPVARVAAGVIAGQPVYSTAASGIAGVAVANSRGIGTCQGPEVAGVAPVWVGPTAVT